MDSPYGIRIAWWLAWSWAAAASGCGGASPRPAGATGTAVPAARAAGSQAPAAEGPSQPQARIAVDPRASGKASFELPADGPVVLPGPAPAWPPAPTRTALPLETVRPSWSTVVDQTPGPRALFARHSVVVALTWKGRVVALDASSGARLWEHAPQAVGVVGDEQRLTVSDSVAVLANEGASAVQALDLRSGQERWSVTPSGRVTSLGSCPGYRLVAATHRDTLAGTTTLVLHALDARDGTTLWKQPVSGDIAGAAAGYLFVEGPSGVGRLGGRIVALRCQDGREAVLPDPSTRFVSLADTSADGAVVLYGFDFERTVQRLCVVRPGRLERQCVDATGLGAAGDRVHAAAVRGRYLYVAMGHLYAHNLDPTPDSAVTVFDLAQERVVARSRPMVANAPFVDAGALLLTSMGGTGAKDFVHLLDPADGRVVRKIALAQAATALAADPARAYAAARTGSVLAFDLPLPGRAEAPAEPIAARVVPPSPPAVAQAPDFDLDELLVIDAHPTRGVTSGQPTAGAVGAVAFVGPAGRWLAAGGNDDRVRLFDLDQGGKPLWQSPSLQKDVEGILSCRAARVAVQTYGGTLRLYDDASTGGVSFRLARTIAHPHAWMFGFTDDCQRLVSDTLQPDEYRIYDALAGSLLGTVASDGRFDRRGTRVRAGRLVLLDPQRQLVVLRVDGAAGPRGQELARLSVPWQIGRETLVQSWAVDETTVLTEHCSSERCLVQLLDLGGAVRTRVSFDVRGGVWSATVPSALDVSADGAYLFFYRDGLEMMLVQLATGQRRAIGATPRTMSATPRGVFSPFDPSLLAVAMRPRPHQVTLLRIRPR